MNTPIFNFWSDLVEKCGSEANLLARDMGDGELIVPQDSDDDAGEESPLPKVVDRLTIIRLRVMNMVTKRTENT